MTDPGSRPPLGRRIALALEYDGAGYCGWQRQRSPAPPSVQGRLEEALSKVAAAGVTVVCAGRTDAGVHASCQVVHFDAPADRGERAWTRGVNSLLPPDIRVLWAKAAAPTFHARFDADARRYCYLMRPAPTASAVARGKLTHIREMPDVAAMDAAARLLPGERDFSAFRAAGCQSRSPFRRVTRAAVREERGLVVFEIEANAFLQHMVRNIAGSLLAVGRGEHPPRWINQLIEGRDRARAAATAPPDGLYLSGVDYPERCGLPPSRRPPVFLAG